MSWLTRLRRRAESDAAVDLCPEEPHVAGLVLGIASLALGVWSSRIGSQLVAGAALLGMLVAMLMYQFWRVPAAGWRVDFGRRRVEPLRQPGDSVDLQGRGWRLRTAAGDKFGQLAIDLMHDDRGRVVRLMEQMALVRWQRRHLLALADTLAQRLDVPRVTER